MGNVLWLLYLADVAQSFGIVLGALGTVFLIATLIISGIQADEAPYREGAAMFWKLVRIRVIIPSVMIVLACLTPSRQLLYIAVGLNVGQEVAQSEIGQKSLTALNAWLDKAIAGDSEKSE